MMATPRRSGFDGWTEVRFGRKGQRFRQPFRDQGNVSGRGKARAFPAPYGRRDSFPEPNPNLTNLYLNLITPPSFFVSEDEKQQVRTVSLVTVASSILSLSLESL